MSTPARCIGVLVIASLVGLGACRGSGGTSDASVAPSARRGSATSAPAAGMPSVETTGSSPAVPAAQARLFEQAAEYSLGYEGASLLVRHRGEVVFESYRAGLSPGSALQIFSGTKSFGCAVAVAAQAEGLLDLDEEVSETVTEWRDRSDLAGITIRQLLSLSSGLEAGTIGNIRPYDQVVAEAGLVEPGEPRFDYGPNPFQVFGAVMERKLAPSGESVTDYLRRKVFDPIGLRYERWLTTPDGDPQLPSGAFLTARDWSLYGQLVAEGGSWAGRTILEPDLLAECFRPGDANPIYGLTFWLPTNPGGWPDTQLPGAGPELLARIGAPEDLVVAAGAGGQRLYVMPSLDLVVVRQAAQFGTAGGFSDAELLAPILAAVA